MACISHKQNPHQGGTTTEVPNFSRQSFSSVKLFTTYEAGPPTGGWALPMGLGIIISMFETGWDRLRDNKTNTFEHLKPPTITNQKTIDDNPCIIIKTNTQQTAATWCFGDQQLTVRAVHLCHSVKALVNVFHFAGDAGNGRLAAPNLSGWREPRDPFVWSFCQRKISKLM